MRNAQEVHVVWMVGAQVCVLVPKVEEIGSCGRATEPAFASQTRIEEHREQTKLPVIRVDESCTMCQQADGLWKRERGASASWRGSADEVCVRWKREVEVTRGTRELFYSHKTERWNQHMGDCTKTWSAASGRALVPSTSIHSRFHW